MRIGFFTVFRTDPQHYLHASALVATVRAVMPDVEIVQLTDERTPIVARVSRVERRAHGPMLNARLNHYAACEGDWLLVDTDVLVRRDVRDVFDDPAFDVALTDRHWAHVPQDETVLHTMPFNTGVVFSRSSAFWRDVLAVWQGYPQEAQDWLSEQRAVYAVVRTGTYRIKILPGMVYNYPPVSASDDTTDPAIEHYKGPRKAWLSTRATRVLSAAPVEVCV